MITFTQKYRRETFLDFLRNHFIKDFQKDIRVVDIPGQKVIKHAHILGTSLDLDLAIFELEHTGGVEKRVTLTKEAFNILRDSGSFRALAVFHSPDTNNWRFSLMTATPVLNQKGKVKTVLSNPKRFSFLLGPDAKVATPTKFLIKKGEIQSLDDLKERFSIEVVNKEFYKEISQLFIELVGGTLGSGKKQNKYDALLKLPGIKDTSQTAQEFAVRLIGRLIFCWFLREKRNGSEESLMPKSLVSYKTSQATKNYYHEILEPIFFKILNCPLDSRKEEKYREKPYNNIPYLNGGLFTPHEDDFYSTNETKQLENNKKVKVPDKWIQRLFEILEIYNFTIDENSSFDEELSIDPEMLGRIFENLLAEINPETGESARKSTGSYYTPRVIVDYMVDESLYLYLKNKTSVEESKLRALISYNLDDDTNNPLSQAEKEEIVNALDELKILDPACGSGAFPMGALQKIVFMLQQLDPQGQFWFKTQIKSVPVELRKNLEREHKEKNFDYIRKLGIIRKNIFGVDIQPIATEISRLRCFLTLVVDQKVDDRKENRGIDPLPNLDFKFVTANSLISLPDRTSDTQTTRMFEDESSIEKLKEVRDQFFNASNFERIELKDQFLKIQLEMSKYYNSIVKDAGADLTEKLLSWDPFSHQTTDWFDSEWMFGIKEGFDILIANPPYLKERDNKSLFIEINCSEIGRKYHQGKMDFWYYFLHKALDLVSNSGTISYITSRYWLNSIGARKLIQRLRSEASFLSLVDIGKLKVFNQVVGQHMIAIYSKKTSDDDFTYKLLKNDISDINRCEPSENLKIRTLKNSQIYSDDNQIELNTDELVYRDFDLLGDVYDVTQGVVQNPDKVSRKAAKSYNLTYGDGVFVLNISELSSLNLTNKEERFVRDFFDENNIQKYSGHSPASKFLLYITKENCQDISEFPNLKKHLEKFKKIMDARRETKKGLNQWFHLHWPREERYFTNPKIVIPGMFDTPKAEYIEKNAYFGLSTNIIIQKKAEYPLKYLLAIINSSLAKYWFYMHGKKRGIGVDIGVTKLRNFPIKKANRKQQKELVSIIDSIITSIDSSTLKAQIKAYEKQINQLIYLLYGLTSNEVSIVEGFHSDEQNP